MDNRYLIEQKLQEIHQVLERDEEKIDKFSMLGGHPGLALYYATAYRVYQDEQLLTKATDILTLSLDRAMDTPHQCSYSYGLSGVMWLTEYFIKNDFVDSSLRKDLKGCDEFIIKNALAALNDGNYDFLHGALGMVYYLFERPNSKKKREYLTKIFECLKAMQRTFKDTMSWPAFNQGEHNLIPGQIDLGLSHGLASILVFLCLFYEQGIPCKEMIVEAVDLLLACEDINEAKSGRFPYKTGDGCQPEKTRLAWCYGDLGIAIAIWKAGNVLGNVHYKSKAIQILDYNCHRRDREKNLVLDAGLCHGTSGNAQVYHHFYKVTGNLLYQETSRYWIEETLKSAQFSEGLAGYKFFHNKHGWLNLHGMLEGLIGVGLALLTSYTDQPLDWDRFMLFDRN